MTRPRAKRKAGLKPDDLADKEAVRAMQQGEDPDRWFPVLVKNNKQMMFRLVLPILNRNVADADEVVMDALEAALRSIRKYDPNRAKVSTWLCEIAKRRALHKLRDDSTGRRRLDRFLYRTQCSTEGHGPQAALWAEELNKLVCERVCLLPKQQKRVVVMVVMHRRKCPEVARMLGLTVRRVKSELTAGLHNLRRHKKEFSRLRKLAREVA